MRGRNIAPEDLEQAVLGQVPECIAAAAVEVAGTEGAGVALVLECARGRLVGPSEVLDRVRRVLSERFDLAAEQIVLVKARQIPRTTSGKVRRQACGVALARGELPVVAAWSASIRPTPAFAVPMRSGIGPSAQLETAIAALFAAALRDFHPESARTLFELGGDSMAANSILGGIEQAYGVRLDVEAAFAEFTVEKLARSTLQALLSEISQLSDVETQQRLASVREASASLDAR